jgi:hypothetical protein
MIESQSLAIVQCHCHMSHKRHYTFTKAHCVHSIMIEEPFPADKSELG